MAVAIRLRREGNRNRPYYRVVVTDSRQRRDGRFLEQVGTYDPLQKGQNSQIDLAKVDAWIAQGAQPSETVRTLINKARKATPSEPAEA